MATPDHPIDQRISSITVDVGLPPEFLDEIGTEPSEWSMVLKLHAVVDAVLADAIRGTVANARLDRHLLAVNFDGRASRLELADDLGLLHPQVKRYMKALTQLRNAFAHDPRNVFKSIIWLIRAEWPQRERVLLGDLQLFELPEPSPHAREEIHVKRLVWTSGQIAVLSVATRRPDKSHLAEERGILDAALDGIAQLKADAEPDRRRGKPKRA